MHLPDGGIRQRFSETRQSRNSGFRVDENSQIEQKVREKCVISKSHFHKRTEIKLLQNSLYGRLSRRRYSCAWRPTVGLRITSDAVGFETSKNVTRTAQGKAAFAFESVFLRNLCVRKKALSGTIVHVSPEPASNLVRPGCNRSPSPGSAKAFCFRGSWIRQNAQRRPHSRTIRRQRRW